MNEIFRRSVRALASDALCCASTCNAGEIASVSGVKMLNQRPTAAVAAPDYIQRRRGDVRSCQSEVSECVLYGASCDVVCGVQFVRQAIGSVCWSACGNTVL